MRSTPARPRIAVTLAGGGAERIEVADDGSGMDPADLALALERHATSKLPGDSLDQVATLGFRGEALPSIASVARVRIESRVRGQDGWSRIVDNGRLVSEGPAALPPGTRVTVEQLFEKVPARRKFLRSGRSEYAACLDMVKRLAMARPDIGFTLDHDGRRSLSVPPGEDRPGRVAALTTPGPRRQQPRHRLSARARAIGRGRRPADLQPRRRRPSISVRQRPAGEGPAADRRGARRLSGPARPRPPSGARLVHRPSRRGGRRQRPPGQDRGAVPRSRRGSAG